MRVSGRAWTGFVFLNRFPFPLPVDGDVGRLGTGGHEVGGWGCFRGLTNSGFQTPPAPGRLQTLRRALGTRLVLVVIPRGLWRSLTLSTPASMTTEARLRGGGYATEITVSVRDALRGGDGRTASPGERRERGSGAGQGVSGAGVGLTENRTDTASPGV